MIRLTSAQTHRAAGVLLSAAAGDALGAGYEFTYPAATPADRHDRRRSGRLRAG